MSGYGIFESAATDGHEQEQRHLEAQKSLDSAIFAAREQFGEFLGEAMTRWDFDDRLALVKDDMRKVVEAHGILPVTGVMNKVAKALKPNFKAKQAAARKLAENFQPGDKVLDTAWGGLLDDQPGTVVSVDGDQVTVDWSPHGPAETHPASDLRHARRKTKQSAARKSAENFQPGDKVADTAWGGLLDDQPGTVVSVDGDMITVDWSPHGPAETHPASDLRHARRKQATPETYRTAAEDWYQKGRDAYARGEHGAPSMNAEVMQAIGNRPVGDPETRQILEQWTRGWHDANLADESWINDDYHGGFGEYANKRTADEKQKDLVPEGDWEGYLHDVSPQSEPAAEKNLVKDEKNIPNFVVDKDNEENFVEDKHSSRRKKAGSSFGKSYRDGWEWTVFEGQHGSEGHSVWRWEIQKDFRTVDEDTEGIPVGDMSRDEIQDFLEKRIDELRGTTASRHDPLMSALKEAIGGPAGQPDYNQPGATLDWNKLVYDEEGRPYGESGQVDEGWNGGAPAGEHNYNQPGATVDWNTLNYPQAGLRTADHWKFDQKFQRFLLDVYGTTHGLTDDEIIEALEQYAGIGTTPEVIGDPVDVVPPGAGVGDLLSRRKQSSALYDYDPDFLQWVGSSEEELDALPPEEFAQLEQTWQQEMAATPAPQQQAPEQSDDDGDKDENPFKSSRRKRTAGYQATNWRDYPSGQPDPTGWGGDVYADYEDALYPSENPRAKITGEESYGEYEYTLEVTDGSGQVVLEDTFYDLAEAKDKADKQLQKLYKGEGKIEPGQGKFFTTPGKGKLF